MASTLAVAGALNLDGDVDIDNSTTTIDSSSAISLDAGAASNFSTSAGDLTVEAGASNAKVVIKGDHESGTAIHIDGNAAAGAVVDIDAGILDIDATGAANIDAGGAVSIDAAGASNFTTSSGALTSELN